MRRVSYLTRACTLLLTLLLATSCFVALPAAAEDLNVEEVVPENFSWMVDFNAMSSVTDNQESKDYSLTATSLLKHEVSPTDPSKKVMKITNGSGNYRVLDTNDILDNYKSFTIEADFYFDQFPAGTKGNDGVTTANQYPLSLITWGSTTPNQFRSIRLDADGYICTSANSTSRTELKIPLQDWFTLRLAVEPASGLYVCTLITEDGAQSFTSSFAKGVDVKGSFVRLFDGYYKYSACVSHLSVTTSSKAVTITKEESADYYGYQTKPVQNGTFDLRVLASLSPESFSATRTVVSDRFVEAGFEVTAIWEENSVICSSVQTMATSMVYSSIMADGDSFSLPSGDYIVPMIICGIDASLPRIELVIKPYTVLLNGEKLYGERAILIWNGQLDSKRCPVFSSEERTSLYTLLPSDDTFVGFQKSVGSDKRDESTPNGDLTELYLKNQSGTNYDRNIYMKFTLSDVGSNRLENAAHVFLRMYCGAYLTESEMTEEELAAGGASIAVYGTTTDWDEDTLDSTNYRSVSVIETINDGELFKKNEWVTIDVTEYVKKHAGEGAISFMIEKVGEKSMSSTPHFRSKERVNYEPHLVVSPTLYNHQTTLEKVNNVGYEPWSYAQMLVDEWINEGYKNTYTAGDVQWHIDFDEMSGKTDNMGNPYTLTSSSVYNLVPSPTNSNETVLGVSDNKGSYNVVDTNNILGNYGTFSVEADFYFEAFPYGGKTPTDETSAASYPLNLIRWMPRTDINDVGIRINDRGELCTNANATSGTGVFVPKDKWFTIRIDVDRANNRFTVFLDGEEVYTKSRSIGEVTGSKVYILDGYFKYSACFKDVRVYNGIYTVYDVNNPNITTPTGAYSIPITFRYNQMGNSVQKSYLRSIETLATEGYNTSVPAPEYDQYGGIRNTGIEGQATGYFHTETIGNRLFIIDPLGNPYFAVGMNTVEIGASNTQKKAALDKYGTAENFYSSIANTFREIGVNTVWGGEWQELIETNQLATIVGLPGIAQYMSYLQLTDQTGAERFIHNNTMNVFDPDFSAYVRTEIKNAIGSYANDPRILGYTSDNEIPSQSTMLYDYLTIDPSEPLNAFSYAAAWTFLIARTGKVNPSLADITNELSEEFKCFVYDRYYHVIRDALDYAGAKQMYLGNRIHGDNRNSEGYLRAASQHVDVLTVNLYGGPQPSLDTIQTMYRYSGKPFLVTEFYAKAIDSVDMNGIPLMNQRNAGWIVKNQEERGIHYENYAMRMLETRCCVGWTWYRFRDNDQRVYKDARNNIYVDYEITSGEVSSYICVGTLNADGTYNLDQSLLDVVETIDLSVKGDPLLKFVSDITLDQLTVIYSGEHGGDESNNGSNKGLFDNYMNIYQPLADAFARVDRHIMSLVNYFDALYAN